MLLLPLATSLAFQGRNLWPVAMIGSDSCSWLPLAQTCYSIGYCDSRMMLTWSTFVVVVVQRRTGERGGGADADHCRCWRHRCSPLTRPRPRRPRPAAGDESRQASGRPPWSDASFAGAAGPSAPGVCLGEPSSWPSSPHTDPTRVLPPSGLLSWRRKSCLTRWRLAACLSKLSVLATQVSLPVPSRLVASDPSSCLRPPILDECNPRSV